MKVNGRVFNFDRCMKFVFTGPKITTTDAEGTVSRGQLTVEYCPRKDERLCPHLEADIKDMPSPNTKDKPGYSGVLKIFNPGKDIVQMVAQSVTWFAEYTTNANGEPTANARSDASVKKYYANKMRVKVYAGYYDEDMGDGDYGNAPIMDGYVNNTYYYRKGTDNILVLYCHDVDMTQASSKILGYGEMTAKEEDKLEEYLSYSDERRKGKATFDATFKNLVNNFEKELRPLLPISEWFRVIYVRSPEEYYYNAKENPNVGVSVEDPRLAAVCRDTLNTTAFYTNADKISGMLNDLCNYQGLNLGWQLDKTYASKPTYIVYTKESAVKVKTNYKLNDKGVVTIWNFQNLLEQPVIDGTGSLSVKMFFNRRCAPWAYIALRVTTDLELDEGFATINQMGLFLQGSKLVGGFAGQAQNPAVSTTQLSGSTGVAASLGNKGRALDYGYLYNNSYLIVSTNHKLNTHGNDWMTYVKTVPLVRGTLARENTR